MIFAERQTSGCLNVSANSQGISCFHVSELETEHVFLPPPVKYAPQ